jgi:Flp pilus assembly protein TadG
MTAFLLWPCSKGKKSKPSSLLGNVSGNTAVAFALAILPIVALAGFSVDFRRSVNVGGHMQDAVDSAVLAATRTYALNSGETKPVQQARARAVAVDHFFAAMAGSGSSRDLDPPSVTFTEDHKVVVKAETSVPSLMSGLVGIQAMPVSARAVAEVGDYRSYEIVLVLDNTTSMFSSDRFSKMRTAAKTFTDMMFDAAPAADFTRVAVVPWGTTVNIDVERPGSWAPAQVGASNPPAAGTRLTPRDGFESRVKYLLHHENGSALSATDLNGLFAPVEWRGCIKAAPGERKVSNSGSVTSTLTDAAVSGMKWPVALIEPEMQTRWVNETPPKPKPKPTPKPKPNPGPTPAPKPKPNPTPKPKPVPKPKPKPVLEGHMIEPSRPLADGFMLASYHEAGPALQSGASITLSAGQAHFGGATLIPARATYFIGNVLNCSQSSWQDGLEGARNVHIPVDTDCSNNNKKKKTGVSRACVSDPNEFAWVAGGGKICDWQKNILPWDRHRPVSGPNMTCPTAMLGLSGSRAQVMAKLDHMYPVPGGTHADVGLMWGLRAISDQRDWTRFFGYSNDFTPGPFKSENKRKIMILLTDGENMAPQHYEGYYGCNEGNSRNKAGSCWKSSDVKKLDRNSLDALMLDSCRAIREDYEVELYTIAVDVSDSRAISLLQECAGQMDRAFDVSSDDLLSTFEGIAKRELRLVE